MEVLSALINTKGIAMSYSHGAPPHIRYTEALGYTVTLTCGNKQITFPHYVGIGEPEIDEVISWLLIRSEALDLNYEKYCEVFEYEPNKTAKILYQQDLELGKMVKALLGDDFKEFMNNNDY